MVVLTSGGWEHVPSERMHNVVVSLPVLFFAKAFVMMPLGHWCSRIYDGNYLWNSLPAASVVTDEFPVWYDSAVVVEISTSCCTTNHLNVCRRRCEERRRVQDDVISQRKVAMYRWFVVMMLLPSIDHTIVRRPGNG